MALVWDWNKKIGEAEIARGEERFTVNLYQGNAFLIMLYEYTDNDGKEKYSMYSFFADEYHAKNCFGLSKGSSNIFHAGERIAKVRLNKKKYRYTKELVGMLVRAFDEIQIEIFSEGDAE